MKLTEMVVKQNLILQMSWGERVMEFPTEVVDVVEDGVCVKAVFHDGKPIDLDININSKVTCNIFTNELNTNKRISWKNIEVKTLRDGDRAVYFLSTNGFNSISKSDDRRQEERIKVQKRAQLFDDKLSTFVDIMVYDISDMGISFYAPSSYEPSSSRFTVLFTDSVGDQGFSMKIECSIARTKPGVGTVFYGCKILGENKEYLLYGFLKKLERKKKEKGISESGFIEAK